MQRRSRSLLTFLAAAMAAVVFIAPPLTFLALEFQYEHAAISSEAEINAKVVGQLINSNPELWEYEQLRLEELLSGRPDEGTREARSVFSLDGRPVAQIRDDLLPPLITERATLYDSGRPVGRIEIARSFRQPLERSAWIALGSFLLGALVFAITYALPLRALRKTFGDLEREKEKALVTLQSIGDAVITTNAQMVVDYLNPIAEKLTGWTTEQASGMHIDSVFSILDEQTREPAVNPIAECLRTEAIVEIDSHTILVRRTDQAEFHIEESASPIRKPDGSIIGAVMVFQDVTERKGDQNRLHHIAFHDALTGLPNRALFQDRLSRAILEARKTEKPVAVLFMDLDRFKTINDSLGHGIGDELLVLVAKRLERCVREGDTVSRMGGDEFTAVLRNMSHPENAGNVANKIIDALTQPFHVQGQELRISTSIGITVYPSDGDDCHSLLKNADIAMYCAKKRGRNNAQFYSPAMGEGAMEALFLENALHKALANNEYELEYQPKLNLKINRIVGVEALLRWNSPILGRVMPSGFIWRLEESGEIVQVGRWVLKTAIAQAKEWMDSGIPLVVSVNVSARQFSEPDFVGQVASLLRDAGLPFALLQIEVTENLLMEDSDRIESAIRELNELGVKVSLDDFGTGYSSLSYLKRFPISELKIDRSFIVDIGKSNIADKVVRTIIDLGQALNMLVTAEGVETEEQQAGLRAMGCDELQGYLLSTPLGKSAFDEWLKFGTLERDLFDMNKVLRH